MIETKSEVGVLVSQLGPALAPHIFASGARLVLVRAHVPLRDAQAPAT